MTNSFKPRPTPPPPMPRSWRRALQHLDAALEQTSPGDNRELIEIFGRHHFGDLWKPRDLNSND